MARQTKGGKADQDAPTGSSSPERTVSFWWCLLVGVIVGWGGVGGALAIVGFQERDLATAAIFFLRGGLVGVPLGVVIGLFAYLRVR